MKFTVFIISLSIFYAVGAISSNAQSIEGATSKINEIKRDTTYIYAEATTKIQDEALADAKAILEANINQWIKSNKADKAISTIAIAKLEKELSEIQTTRGDFYRAFVYVKKSLITTIDKDSNLILCEQHVPHSELTEKQQENPVMPVVVNLSEANVANNISQAPKYQPTEFEKTMLTINRFEKIKSYINNLKEENLVLDYGKYQTIPSIGECYLFIYDKNGNIPACLHRTTVKYINIKDGSEDDINNYDGCGALWFSLK